MSLARFTFALVVLLLGLTPPPSARGGDPPLTTVRVASGFWRPVFLTSPRGDYRRLFVVELVSGKIKIIKNGEVITPAFLDIGHLLDTDFSEHGLLGMAFHPDYANNGYFYVYYVRQGDKATVIARYQVSINPDQANPASATILQVIDQPHDIHNGGMLAFGPDGYLYVGTGDGGPGTDPQNNAQNPALLLGKMLRVDVDHPTGWGIPANNPYVGDPSTRDEIWAMGLRNPWRYSFDRETGDLYIGDVGQESWEEIDFQPATSTGGENYGWSCMEGSHCYIASACTCNAPSLTLPIHEIDHNTACAVTGGYVYRGKAIPGLEGTYFFADFCTTSIWSFRYDGANLTDFTNRTAELAPPAGTSIDSIPSFGQDAWGELYIVDQDGDIFKIVPQNPLPSWSNYGAGWPGTLGVPSIALSDVPILCTSLDLLLGNSYGAPSLAALVQGTSPASDSTIWDGTLLVGSPIITNYALPAGGLTQTVDLPCDPIYCNLEYYVQFAQVDPGATKGVSFSEGLKLTLGI